MTSTVMDSILDRFSVIKFYAINQMFGPNLYESKTIINDHTKLNNKLGLVIETGWKINDCIVRAAKVDIIKK